MLLYLERILNLATSVIKVILAGMWESNPPKKLLTPHTGFEDQREHQNPSTPETK